MKCGARSGLRKIVDGVIDLVTFSVDEWRNRSELILERLNSLMKSLFLVLKIASFGFAVFRQIGDCFA